MVGVDRRGRSILVQNQTANSDVIFKLECFGMNMCEQREEDRAKDAPWWHFCVLDEGEGCAVSSLTLKSMSTAAKLTKFADQIVGNYLIKSKAVCNLYVNWCQSRSGQ